MASNTQQPNGIRGTPPQPPPVILHLMPLNNTFERKTITVPYYPDVLRIGRQTNQKTLPTPLNGFFDSKVLSRQHAEIWAERDTGLVFIRDVKSSNGTFVNGERLSPENRESEPRQLAEGNLLELGIDIVSEDQKTVVHHKVSSKVEHAGYFGQTAISMNDPLHFGELDPSNGGQMVNGTGPLRRNGSQGAMAGNRALGQGAGAMGQAQPQGLHMRNWLNPISMEHIVKKLNAELKYAEQQSKDLDRAKQAIEAMLAGKPEAQTKELKEKSSSEKSGPSPIKSKTDLKAHFSEPPAPPPSAPLPEKPDVARALADPMIQTLLRRSDTARPGTGSEAISPTKVDHSSDILKLCEELKLAKGELTNQNQRMQTLETELAQERTARESAEERAQRLEDSERRDSPREGESRNDAQDGPPDLRVQLDRLRASMDEMKQQMESFRLRAETSEAERDSARKSLAEMVEQKRSENAERTSSRSPNGAKRSPSKHSSPTTSTDTASKFSEPNGHALVPSRTLMPSNDTTSSSLLSRAGIEEGRPISPEQAQLLTQLLTQEVLKSNTATGPDSGGTMARSYHAHEMISAAAVVLVGCLVMGWMNGWQPVKVDR